MLRKITNFLPVFFILAVWFIFAHPYFLQNKVPFTSTYQVNNFAPWSAYEKFWGPVKNGAMPDVITQIYPWRHLAIEILKSGQIPLWNPYSFSGNPLLANYQSAVFSPFNVLFFILPFVEGWSILVLLQPLLAGFFMYLFVRGIGEIRVSRVGALISSISFMFCGFITVWMGYATLGYAILFLPFALFCAEKYYQTQKRIFLLLLSLTLPLSFFSGHFQISTYFLFTVLVYIIYKFVITKNIPSTLYLILYISFGLLLVMPQVLPSIELYFESFRSSFFQTGSIPLQYIPTFIAADFFGNPVTRNTWFGHYAEWNAYIGVLPLMLAIYSILRIKNHQVLFLFFLGVLSLLLATNNPISNFILNLHIPILSTGTVSRIIVLYSFSFIVVAGFGYDQLILDISNKRKRWIAFWIGMFAIFFLILWVAVGQKPVARQNLILPTVLFLASVFVVVFAVVIRKYKYEKVALKLMGFLLLFLVAFDMLRFAIKWQAFDPKYLVFPETPTARAFSKISGFNRVLGNLGGEASIYYKLPSVEGYDALYSKRYGQFIGFIEKEEIIESSWSVVSFPKHSQRTSEAINLLDIKYIVHKLADNRFSWTFPLWRYPEGQFRLVYKDDKYEFYENKNAFPHAFLVGNYRVIQDPKQILETIFNDDFNLREEIILEVDAKIKKSEGNIGSVNIESYTPNKIMFSLDAKKDGLIFMADAYNKGWKAKIDGVDTPIYRANYTFRALPVKKGNHKAELIYDPLSFKIGVMLAVFGVFGIASTFLVPRILAPSK